MNELGWYLIKSGLALLLSYGFYWLLLRQETFFLLNRFYLLIALLTSFIFPLINLPINVPVLSNLNATLLAPVVIESNPVAVVDPVRLNFLNILLLIYLSGAIFFLIRFLVQLIQILVRYYKFPRVLYSGFTTVVVDRGKSPASFFHILFLSPEDLGSNHVDTIVAHENYHKSHLHSLDIVLIEVLTIFQWFNPFIWFYKNALRAQHEYAADRNMVRNGGDRYQYQSLLFEKVVGINVNNFMSYFNNSLLKTRIIMMNKNESNRWVRLKYLFAIPLFLLLVIGLFPNQNIFAQQNTEISNQPVQMPVYPGGKSAMFEYIRKSIRYPKSAKHSKTEGKFFVSFVVDKKGQVTDVEVDKSQYKQNVVEDIVVVGFLNENIATQADKDLGALFDEAKIVVSKLKRFTPGKKDGINVDIKITIPFQFKIG